MLESRNETFSGGITVGLYCSLQTGSYLPTNCYSGACPESLYQMKLIQNQRLTYLMHRNK